MNERLSQLWPRIQLWTCNAFIATVIALILVEAIPLFPMPLRQTIRRATDPIVDKLGIWQGEWGMFAPQGDTVNYRFSADVDYADGTQAQWNSPDWRRLSYWQRFAASRRLEFLDNTGNPVTLETILDDPEAATRDAPLKEALAEFILRTLPEPRPEARVKQVRIWLEEAFIPDASELPWQTMAELPPYEEKMLLHERNYP